MDAIAETRPPSRREQGIAQFEECYRFLALKSRWFVAGCQELRPELLLPVVVFYLVLRSLDTIEDMAIGIEEKEPLLRNFHTHVDDESWTFDGSGPDEKDREVLVKCDCVARVQFAQGRIANGMGNGTADYARMADANANGLRVKTIKDYELYCHYVAGLVGEEGLTRLFVQADFVDPALLTQKPELMESMGQLLHQANIIRDIQEDYDSG
ncbi:farnesyl-diphosphate farnesyltransferase [Blastomyces percursus]|uniref:Farnesyl-diphosphate farnesyltransferase n=1 Tax=Blastomyces percursus TaxID=1658174 RepID=A0A1J9RC21_9EURO|nr:farnesyl-diphosphate farnesyltransferase [Blastomyces percursus]